MSDILYYIFSIQHSRLYGISYNIDIIYGISYNIDVI